ncbi:MAG: hypothetical protein AB1765_09570 [Candidatus Hydrogenedentota bacterium]
MTDKKINSEEIINMLKENTYVLIKYGVKKIGLFGGFVRPKSRIDNKWQFKSIYRAIY